MTIPARITIPGIVLNFLASCGGEAPPGNGGPDTTPEQGMPCAVGSATSEPARS